MNTVILVTTHNLEEVKKFAEELSKRQKKDNSGKLLITGGSYLPDEDLHEIKDSLSGQYEAFECTKVQLSETPPHYSQVATMIAVFMMQRYVSVPGPWLVIDGYTSISDDDPLSIFENQHNLGMSENSGRAIIGPDQGVVPIGPVVLGASVKKIKTLRSTSGEDWRQRGRFAFKICSWNQIDPQDYPFKIAESPDASPVESFDGAQPIAAKKKSVSKKTASAGDDNPKASEPSKSELFARIAKLGGEKPHHATGIKRLKKNIADLEKSVSQ